MTTTLKLIRDVTAKECPWLGRDFLTGETVYKFTGHTYGCIGPNGIAVSGEPGETPFFELPRASVSEAQS